MWATGLSYHSTKFSAADGSREHNMVRFVNGVPKYVWYSQHASGQAFKYEVVKKDKSGFRVSYLGAWYC